LKIREIFGAKGKQKNIILLGGDSLFEFNFFFRRHPLNSQFTYQGFSDIGVERREVI